MSRGDKLRHAMTRIAALLLLALFFSRASFAHPMGNFSISHYAGIRIDGRSVEVRYVIDEAEIPTFQEMQRAGLVADASDPGAEGYLREEGDALKEGLKLELDGAPLALETVSAEVIFPAGAGGLPTMKLGYIYRASWNEAQSAARHTLRYRDGNFPDRAGWKEVVVTAAPDITLERASVPGIGKSDQLSNYPTDLLNSPPQDLAAEATFVSGMEAGVNRPALLQGPAPMPPARVAPATESTPSRITDLDTASRSTHVIPQSGLTLQANLQQTPRNAFTELMRTGELSFSIVLLAAAVALGLGGLHALEPGHGKTLVAAYLVGSRGTAFHALVLGLIVTVSHTAGVFLLGAITLYAQRYVVPEQLYPWLGVVSGLTIVLLGCYLLLQRLLGLESGQLFAHSHGSYRHGGFGEIEGEKPSAATPGGTEQKARNGVTIRELLALGITGGIVPCPAALVVLLSAVALHRVGFGLFLIVVFSAGLAAVLIATGMVVVFAGGFLARWNLEGGLIQRWLPIASATAVTTLGAAIALRALQTVGVFQIRL